MKFARYLQDTQTPEWKRAYIDYRGLKKCITVIRRAQENPRPESNETSPPGKDQNKAPEDYPEPRLSSTPVETISRSEKGVETSHLTQRRDSPWTRRTSIVQQATASVKLPNDHPISPPLCQLLSELTPEEAAFFNLLNVQLEKVESFYSNREKDYLLRTRLLQEQLNELRDHRKLVRQTNAYNATCTSAVTTNLKFKLRPHPILKVPKADSNFDRGEVQRMSSPKGKAARDTNRASRPIHSSSLVINSSVDDEQGKIKTHGINEDSRRDIPRYSNSDNYLYAKKKLKKAVLEHYRALELLQNYRILNLTGFRKALKKFDKVTKNQIQEQYMTEKVDKSALASDKPLQEMMKQIQELFAHAFVRGDLKKAMNRLRGGARTKTHHSSTFRSGILMGIALPALASGVYYSSLEDTYEDIQAWDALLYIYGLLFVPIIYSILVGLNLLVWARSRINYTFIFGLNLRTRMDYREYFEMPVFLFATLCYAFWLSFAGIGPLVVSPTTWPLLWLGLTAVTLFYPLPILFRPSRFWLLRTMGKLCVSGTRRVEFTDFWMGDQLCSLAYTLSNMSMFACIYVKGFSEDWTTCGSQSRYWPLAFGLAAIPSFIRLVQSIKRYADSRLITHLINGGKYGIGIINYLFYYLWRHQKTRYNSCFVLWLISATVSSAYASCWDLLMDWSLLKPRAKKFLLRDNLGYPNHIYLYYFAIVSNCLIRFAWVFYIPEQGPNMLIRSFIIGLLEVLRRIQWNFFRVENEHLGNMDQYRVIREIPLPYIFDSGTYDEDGYFSESQSPTRDRN